MTVGRDIVSWHHTGTTLSMGPHRSWRNGLACQRRRYECFFVSNVNYEDHFDIFRIYIVNLIEFLLQLHSISIIHVEFDQKRKHHHRGGIVGRRRRKTFVALAVVVS